MIDFYFKGNNDITFKDYILEESSELENIISQIKMLLFTNNGDVLGATSMGLNIEKLIFETNYNNFTILNNFKYQMGQFLVYDNNTYNIDYDLTFHKGTVRDIAIFHVMINGQRALDILIK